MLARAAGASATRAGRASVLSADGRMLPAREPVPGRRRADLRGRTITTAIALAAYEAMDVTERGDLACL